MSKSELLHNEHPEWYHACDYDWLKHVPKPILYDAKKMNELDDINRRNIANWFRTEEEDEEL